MKLRLGILCLVLLLSNCAKRHEGEEKPTLGSNFREISENENRGIQDILQFLGGRCEYSQLFKYSTEGQENGFEIELSQSPYLQSGKHGPGLIASNVAYRFYRNLEDERKKYDKIRVNLIYGDGVRKVQDVPCQRLEKIDRRVAFLEKTVKLLKRRDYAAIRPWLDDSTLFLYHRDTLIKGLELADNKWGKIRGEWEPWCFTIVSAKESQPLLRMSGYLQRMEIRHEFTMVVDLEEDKEEIYWLNYSFQLPKRGENLMLSAPNP